MIRVFIAVLLLVLSLPFPVLCEEIAFLPFSPSEFNPSMKETVGIPVKLTVAAEVKVEISSPDGDLITTLVKPEILAPGTHEFVWDGRDSQGKIVPNEAYVPSIKAKLGNGEIIEVAPRLNSGGEVVENLQVEVTPTQEITYHLPTPSRVLIRTGIKNGPMMRSLANWDPKAAGKNVLRWNGYDSDNLVDLRNNDKISVLVMAYSLPDYSIISTGNDEITYFEYRSSRSWPDVRNNLSDAILERGGKRISRNYYVPRYKNRDPRVFMTIESSQMETSNGVPILGDATLIKVDIPKEDLELIQDSLYEVAFFVDNEFVSEEEQGYMPITWSYSPVGLSEGNHILTVNVSSLDGKIGVRSLVFNIQL